MTTDTGKLEALREEVRAFLGKNLPDKWGTPDYKELEAGSPEAIALSKTFTKKLYDAGYGGFGVPAKYGGRERSPQEVAVIRSELMRRGIPMSFVGLGRLVVDTLLQWGTEEQKKKFIPPILSGQVYWIEGFSEPNAGSDLAGVQCTAIKKGNEWVVNGQKCWTSGWDYGQWGFLLCKTDLTAPRHRNLGFFLFDCNTPGFSRRPLRQITAEAHAQYGELFFDDMHIPDENRVGEAGRGWYVAMTTLIAERGGGQVSAASGEAGLMRLAGAGGVRSIGDVDDLIDLAKTTKHFGQAAWEDASVRKRIAQFAIENEAQRAHSVRLAHIIRSGVASGNEASMSKLTRTEQGKREGDFACEIIGTYSQLMRGDPRAVKDGDIVYSMLMSRGTTIFMGTSEICRNILSERILGLPRS
jgi:alkylation response protein AidB-like acyl-CoA dehydrogenase